MPRLSCQESRRTGHLFAYHLEQSAILLRNAMNAEAGNYPFRIFGGLRLTTRKRQITWVRWKRQNKPPSWKPFHACEQKEELN